MNNNDLLEKLHTDCKNISPTDKVNPETIEESLVGVKRSKRKAIATISTFTFVFFAVALIFTISNKNNVQTNPMSPVVIEKVSNYEDVYNAIKEFKNKKTDDGYNMLFESMQDSDSLTSGSANNINGTTTNGNFAYSSKGESDFSNTNVQVQGIDEADVVKTDGTYIYVVKPNKGIFITKTNNGKPELVSKIKVKDTILEMFINGNNLIVIATDDVETNKTSTPDEASYFESISCYGYNENVITKVHIYDVTNAEKPTEKSVLTQSGRYISARMINDIIYLVSHHTIYDYNSIEKDDPTTYCPLYGKNEELKCIEADAITIGSNFESVEYLNVSSIDLKDYDDFANISSLLGGSSDIYCSYDNLYVASYYWNNGKQNTQLYEFSIDGTSVEYKNNKTINGRILNQFSMDEYDGYFRIVTEREVYSKKNDDYVTIVTLKIYDENLERVGELEKTVDNENIESVRFDGDIAYFVTYENTDPLFTVDLSNPREPKFLSELKISGFSEYLHPFGDGLLLGFGRESDPADGSDLGLKVSMFDVSDKTDVTEITKKIFTKSEYYGDDEDFYAESEAEYNHKAIYVDVENKIIGIPYNEYYSYWGSNDFDSKDKYYYILFKYDKEKEKFEEISKIHHETIKNDSYGISNTRGIKIGDHFYIVTPYEIEAYDYNSFEKVGSVKLKIE